MHVSSSHLAAGFTLACALLLLGVTIPYGLAFGITHPHRHKILAIQSHPEIETRHLDLAPLVPTWQQAINLYPDPRLVSEYAFLLLETARTTPDTTGQNWQDLTNIYTGLLARRPLSPIDWGRLSYVASQTNDLSLARHAWEESIRTGAYLPNLILWRYTHGLYLMDNFSPRQKDLMIRQTKIMLDKNYTDLINLGRLAPFNEKVRFLVSRANPEACEQFLRDLSGIGHTPCKENHKDATTATDDMEL